jgi:hypothetical protein
VMASTIWVFRRILSQSPYAKTMAGRAEQVNCYP